MPASDSPHGCSVYGSWRFGTSKAGSLLGRTGLASLCLWACSAPGPQPLAQPSGHAAGAAGQSAGGAAAAGQPNAAGGGSPAESDGGPPATDTDPSGTTCVNGVAV